MALTHRRDGNLYCLWNLLSMICSKQGVSCHGATVKAGTQERGTEVMWFHTGSYTEMTQEVTINDSFPASYFAY